MNRNSIIALFAAVSFSAVSLANQASVSSSGSQPTDESTLKKPTRVPPDNTSINERDRDETEVTAENQSMSDKDVQVTSRIRQRLVDDDKLSVYSKNIKIITQDGIVTLKGPVPSTAEKNQIGAIAKEIAGKNSVFNELQITR